MKVSPQNPLGGLNKRQVFPVIGFRLLTVGSDGKAIQNAASKSHQQGNPGVINKGLNKLYPRIFSSERSGVEPLVRKRGEVLISFFQHPASNLQHPVSNDTNSKP
jgi:hypothetical protein